MVQDSEALTFEERYAGGIICDDRLPDMTEEMRRELFTPEDEEWIAQEMKRLFG